MQIEIHNILHTILDTSFNLFSLDNLLRDIFRRERFCGQFNTPKKLRKKWGRGTEEKGRNKGLSGENLPIGHKVWNILPTPPPKKKY